MTKKIESELSWISTTLIAALAGSLISPFATGIIQDRAEKQTLKEKLLVRDTLPEALVLKAEKTSGLKRLSDSVDYAKANPHWPAARISRTLTTIGRY